MLDRSTRIPATSRVIIDEDDYLRLIDQMRISVPQEIKNARQIENERDAIIAAAQAQADAMIEAGRDKAQSMASEHEIVSRAEASADRILQESYDGAAAIRAEADAYALEVLERIAAQIDAFGRTVENGIRLLRSEGPRASTDGGRRSSSSADNGPQPEIIDDDRE